MKRLDEEMVDNRYMIKWQYSGGRVKLACQVLDPTFQIDFWTDDSSIISWLKVSSMVISTSNSKYSPGTTRISCLTVWTTPNSTYIESHTFYNLLIDNIFITYRPHYTHYVFRSMLIGTLLALLCQSLFIRRGVPLSLAHIVHFYRLLTRQWMWHYRH